MIFRFNKAQLGRERMDALNIVLEKYQKGEDQELEVCVIPNEFPDKFSVKAGSSVKILEWDTGEKQFNFLHADPEPDGSQTPEPDGSQTPEPEPKPVPDLDLEADKAKIFANKVITGVKAMTPAQRCVFWSEFSDFITGELANAMP